MMSIKKSKIDQNDPLSIIAYDRSRQYEICDELEHIADQLADRSDVQRYTHPL